ncbi:hypothetical protein C0989_006833, partial [Termitomyces sp. Mn162]
MRALKIIEPIEPLEDAIEHHPIPTAGTLLKYASRGQIRTREFESPYLRLLPSIKSPTPPLSHGLEHFTSKTRKTFFAARVRTISTLDTRLLQPSDFIVLSNRKIVLIRVHVGAQKPVVVRYTQSGGLLPFPPDTQGFLYMHINPHLPLLSRQIRFRITASNDPAQFENGTDLLSRDQPWNLDAIQIAHSALLKDHLRHSGHAEYVQALSSLPNNRRKSRRALYYLEQPFVMNMSCKEYTLSIILSDDIRTFQFSSMFLDRRNSERIAPYTGRIVLRFERSSLQEHAGGNFVVFRVLKILDPIKPVDPSYDMHVPVPHVGSLLVNTKTRIPDVKPDLHQKAVRATSYSAFIMQPQSETRNARSTTTYMTISRCAARTNVSEHDAINRYPRHFLNATLRPDSAPYPSFFPYRRAFHRYEDHVQTSATGQSALGRPITQRLAPQTVIPSMDVFALHRDADVD